MAATKNLSEMSKGHVMGPSSFYNPSNHLHNTLLMNMSMSPLHLPVMNGIPMTTSSPMFFLNKRGSKPAEILASSTMSDNSDQSQPTLKEDEDEDDEYQEERTSQVSSPGSESGSRLSGHRNQKRPIPNEQKDVKYYERRRRNNLAAKKSRDARKTREDQLVMRVAHLEKENAIFRAQVAILREEMSVLQLYLCQKINIAGPAAEKNS